jgi:hypothetical protein
MENPTGRYGRFVEKLEAARNRAKIWFVNFLANNPDRKARWKLMKNYWPGEFSGRIIQELSGPDGGPIETKGGPYVLEITRTEKMPDWPILDANGNTPQPIELINGRN